MHGHVARHGAGDLAARLQVVAVAVERLHREVRVLAAHGDLEPEPERAAVRGVGVGRPDVRTHREAGHGLAAERDGEEVRAGVRGRVEGERVAAEL